MVRMGAPASSSDPLTTPQNFLEMFLVTTFFGFIATASAFCGIPPPSDALKEAHRLCANANIHGLGHPHRPYGNTSHAPFANFSIAGRAVKNPFSPTVIINTYVHVISTTKNGKPVGNLLESQITKQVRRRPSKVIIPFILRKDGSMADHSRSPS
jgi:hypothetical protein